MGGAAFAALGLPAPWLSGAMIGVTAGVLLGFRPSLPRALRDCGMLFAGVAMGAAITPEMIRALELYPASLALLALTTLFIVLAGRLLLVRGFGWGASEAAFASLPGALSAVLAAAASSGLDMARITSLQALRLFALVALLPGVASLSLTAGAPLPQESLGAPAFAAILGLGLGAGLLLERLTMAAPFLLGGMLVSGAAHVTGLVTGGMPSLIANAASLFIGVFVAVRFGDLDGAAFRRLLLPGIALFGATMAIASIGAGVAILGLGIPVAEALVAFAPGAIEAMTVLGMALGLDPLYVASHHLARFLLVAASLPWLARLPKMS
jgi:membrane AbrB-like protein